MKQLEDVEGLGAEDGRSERLRSLLTGFRAMGDESPALRDIDGSRKRTTLAIGDSVVGCCGCA